MNMSSENHIAVVIPTWRRVKQLQNLLGALSGQTRGAGEVIVACRRDDKASIAAVKKWSNFFCKIAYVDEKGHIPPLVAALEMCKSEILCLIDDDALPVSNWLERVDENFKDPTVGCIGGKINMYEARGVNEEMVKVGTYIPGKLSWFGRSDDPLPINSDNSKFYEAECFGGSNMAFRTRLLKENIDMTMNEGVAKHYETDIALNIIKMGYQVLYDPQLIVDHYAAPRAIGMERGQNAKTCYSEAHNLTYMCLKHLRWYGKVAFLFYYGFGGQWEAPAPAIYCLSFFRSRRISLKEELLPSMRGRFAGIKSYLQYISGKHSK
jgi:GT2 family glycosyltransferase